MAKKLIFPVSLWDFMRQITNRIQFACSFHIYFVYLVSIICLFHYSYLLIYILFICFVHLILFCLIKQFINNIIANSIQIYFVLFWMLQSHYQPSGKTNAIFSEKSGMK